MREILGSKKGGNKSHSPALGLTEKDSELCRAEYYTPKPVVELVTKLMKEGKNNV